MRKPTFVFKMTGFLSTGSEGWPHPSWYRDYTYSHGATLFFHAVDIWSYYRRLGKLLKRVPRKFAIQKLTEYLLKRQLRPLRIYKSKGGYWTAKVESGGYCYYCPRYKQVLRSYY